MLARFCPALFGLLAVSGAATASTAARPIRIELYPSRIHLDASIARQRVLVSAHYADGAVRDVTPRTRLSVFPKEKARALEGIVTPRSDGNARLSATYAGLTAAVPIVVRNQRLPVKWSFDHHVESVLARQGCSMGPCHGAAAGKGGFRLTLRGYDPDLDYQRIAREGRGRRIVLASPGDSLILRKPSLAAPHVGGLRLRRDSDEYRVLAGWIASGAPGPDPREPRIAGIDVFPPERALASRDRQQLLVMARFSDGHREDVTHWAKFTSSEEAVARVDASGKVEMRGSGETAVSVWYHGKVAFSRLSVPFPNRIASSEYAHLARTGFIDDLIYAKLAQLRIRPSGLCSDSEYIRRAFLDVLGILPQPSDIRAFLAESAPDKRAKLIDSLLERPAYVDYATYKLGDLFRVNRDLLGSKGMWSFQTWLRESVAANKPWDRLAYEVLTAGGAAGPAAFYRAGKTAEEYSETVSQVFLGIRIQCAKCHNHPFEKWTQSDYFRMANFFARVGRKEGNGTPVFFSAATGDVDHPKLGKPLPPTPFDGPRLALDSPVDRRRFLGEWMISPRNPYFARSIVNRIWKQYMGRGLVEPADDMRLTNPATNEPLLSALTRDFIKNGFDLKRLAGTILKSAAYGASSQPNDGNTQDDRFYSRYLVRRLPAETLLDAICQVTGQPEKFPGIPNGARAISLPDTNIASGFLDLFGRPVRQVTCDCERNMEPNVSQALHFISAEDFNKKVSAGGGVVDRLLDSGKTDGAILDELYLACFSRLPTPAESARVLRELAGVGGSRDARRQVVCDLLWALLSSPEFLFNH